MYKFYFYFNDNNNVIALLFSTSMDEGNASCSPIQSILDALNVRLPQTEVSIAPKPTTPELIHLSKGSTGKNVSILQKALNNKGNNSAKVAVFAYTYLSMPRLLSFGRLQ